MVEFISVIIGIVVLLLIGGVLVLVFLVQQQKQNEVLKQAKLQSSETPEAKGSDKSAEAVESSQPVSLTSAIRRRSTNVPANDSNLGTTVFTENRRPSFQVNPQADGGASSLSERRSFSLAPSENLTTSERRNIPAMSPPSPTLNPSPGSSPRQVGLRKQLSGKGVSFSTESSPSLSTQPAASSLGLPVISHLEILEGHADAVESAVFSEEGLLATGGGPEDVLVRVYNRGVGTVGTLRHTLNIQHDCGKHDGPSILNFAIDEGKKSTLLLVGTRSERFLLGYKISRSSSTNPLLAFMFATHHGCPLIGVAGFVPKDAVNFVDHGVFLVTCAKGTRDIKVWNGKGSSIFVLECDCWTMGLRIAPEGNHVAVLSSGGGSGLFLDVKKDKHGHLKFSKTKLGIPIDSTPANTSPHLTSRRSALGDAMFQAAQDVVFQPGGAVQMLCCRVDLAVTIASIANIDTSTQWELETLLKPECLQLSSPTHLATLVPKVEGRNTRVIISRGKHVFFLDAALSLIGVVEGRREDGDVLGIALSPKSDFAIIVAFGANIARIVNVT